MGRQKPLHTQKAAKHTVHKVWQEKHQTVPAFQNRIAAYGYVHTVTLVVLQHQEDSNLITLDTGRATRRLHLITLFLCTFMWVEAVLANKV